MGVNFTYFKLDIVFFAPILVFLFAYFRSAVIKNLRYVIFCSFLGAMYFFIVDPPATIWRAWEFDYSKTMGAKFGLSVVEELIWAILVFMASSIVVSILAEAEERGMDFSSLTKSRK